MSLAGQRPIGSQPIEGAVVVARNVSTRYLAIGIEAALGLVMLPFNIAHLGQAAYGLWMLTASVTAYFSILDLGYSGALLKFVAEYRARRDERSLNEVLSTSFWLFAGFGGCVYLAAILIAMNVGRIFQLTPDQVERQISTSLYGPMNVTRAVLPVMRKQRSGHIITISSSAGLVGFEFGAAYAAS